MRFFATDPRISNPKPVEMHTNAALFIKDGEALGRRATAGQFFLFVHGIELALKGFLHEKGQTLDELQRYGHKLVELMELSKAKGFVPSELDTASIVARLDKSLEKARLRYDFDFDLPMIDDVLRVANGILRDSKPALPPLR